MEQDTKILHQVEHFIEHALNATSVGDTGFMFACCRQKWPKQSLHSTVAYVAYRYSLHSTTVLSSAYKLLYNNVATGSPQFSHIVTQPLLDIFWSQDAFKGILLECIHELFSRQLFRLHSSAIEQVRDLSR